VVIPKVPVFALFQIAKFLPDNLMCISEVVEMPIPFMRPLHATERLDGEPLLFRSRRNFRHIGKDAVGVGAVLAVHLLDQVEVL
jgi:hypothetical protein